LRVGTRGPAAAAAREIERDLCDRQGLKHEWANIAPDIKREIRARWEAIIAEAFRQAEAKNA
jgi:hypothetical protein